MMMTEKKLQDPHLVLGTVQFGLDYGISNADGITPPEETRRILKYAMNQGIEVLDTASGYGESEAVLGRIVNEIPFKIITKTLPLRKASINDLDLKRVKMGFEDSLEKLGQEKVYGLLIHHAGDLLVPGGDKLYEYICGLRNKGIVSKIGVSIYPGDDVGRILSDYCIDVVQLPLNVLDQRLRLDGTIDHLKAMRIEIHVRSLFLQGLLLMPLNDIPSYFEDAVPFLRRYHEALTDCSLTQLDGAYSFAGSVPQIDAIVIGVNNRAQLEENIASFRRSREISPPIDFSNYAMNEESILNPSHWRQ